MKPIVYYVDPATPAKWVPYVKKGIEDWQPAFEAAGFRNAIVATEAPADDPDWSAEDARYSVIRWLPSTTENASGAAHARPAHRARFSRRTSRSTTTSRTWRRTGTSCRSGPLDPRARTLPLPDDLMGELVRFVVAHEVGHTLGFQHNMKASAMYSVEQVRDKNWVKQNGHTPTLMDYSRFNYVAQPEDGIDAGGSDSEDRPVRQVGDDVGLQADSRRANAGRREARRSTRGRGSRTRRRGTASRPRRPAPAIPTTRPKPSATPTPCRPRRSG